MARDIVLIEPDPQDWDGWMNYLLEQMGAEAKRRGKQTDFDEMLRLLQQHLDK